PRFIPWEVRSRFGQILGHLRLKPRCGSDKNWGSGSKMLGPVRTKFVPATRLR
ncbi:hypothetical protein B0H12DRAFT_1083568, partial [Mycena haematopus]